MGLCSSKMEKKSNPSSQMPKNTKEIKVTTHQEDGDENYIGKIDLKRQINENKEKLELFEINIGLLQVSINDENQNMYTQKFMNMIELLNAANKSLEDTLINK